MVHARIVSESAWREWKKVCAAALCMPEHAAMLHRFGSLRFASLLKKIARDGQSVATDGAHGWHLLETYSRVSSTRAGKRYKDWLFARADLQSSDWLGSIESGATLLMRDAVRHHVREEFSPAFMTSLQKNIGCEEGQTTLEDLLPGGDDPLEAIADREWDELAAEMAKALFPCLSPRERAAIWARARGFTFSDPAVLAKAGCGRAHLYTAHREVVERIAAELKRDHPRENSSELIVAARRVIDHLAILVDAKILEEKPSAESFTFV